MKRRTWYGILAVATLTIASGSAILAVAGAALQQAMSVAAASLCAAIFFVPGLYFFAYERRLRTRDLALAHVAALVDARGVVEIRALAGDLHVSQEDAERFLHAAVREGHLFGAFDGRGRFVARPRGPDGERR